MQAMRKVGSISFLRLNLYRDTEGMFYLKVGNRHRKPISPRRLKLTLWLSGIFLFLIVGGSIGYYYGIQYASDKVMDQVLHEIITPAELEVLKKDPEVQAMLEEYLRPSKQQAIPGAVSQGSTKSELNGYRQRIQQEGLTMKVKHELKAEVLLRLTEEEFQALKLLAVLEAVKAE